MGKTLSYTKLKKILDAVDSRIKSLLSNYLPLTGGTINMPGASGFRVNNTLQAGSFSAVMFSKRGVPIGGIAANSEVNFLYRLKPDFSGASQIWDSANDGSGSGLDADLLDGKQPSDLNVGSAGKLTDSAGEYFNRNKLSELKTEIAAKSSTSDSIKIAGVIIPALIAGKGYEEMMSPLRVITAGAIPEDVKTDTNALWYYRGSPDLRKFDSSGNLVSAGISINFESDTLFFCNGKFFTVAGISEMMEVGVCPLYPYGCTDQDNPLSQDAILWQGSPFPASLDGETRYVDERYYKRLTTADKFRIVGYDNIVFDFRVSARVIDPYTKEALIFCEPMQIGTDRCTAMLEVTPDTWTINISQETNIVSANETNTD